MNTCRNLRDDLLLWYAGDGTGRLLHLDGRFFSLSPTACYLLELLVSAAPEQSAMAFRLSEPKAT